MKTKKILILAMILGLLVSFCDDDGDGDGNGSAADSDAIETVVADFAEELSNGTATSVAALFSSDSNAGSSGITDSTFSDLQDLYAPLTLSGVSVDLDADPVTATATDGDDSSHTFEMVKESGEWYILRWLVDDQEQLTKPGQ